MAKFIKVNNMLDMSKKANPKPSYINADNIIFFREASDTEIRIYNSKVSEIVVKTGNGTRTYTVQQTVDDILAQIIY